MEELPPEFLRGTYLEVEEQKVQRAANSLADGERREALRKFVMTCAAEGKIEFDALYERVVAHMP